VPENERHSGQNHHRRQLGCGSGLPVRRRYRRALVSDHSVNVRVTLETAELFQIFRREHFAAVEFLRGILERVRHPVVHSKIQVGHDENRSLESFSQIERFVSHLETFFDARWEQEDMFRVAVGLR